MTLTQNLQMHLSYIGMHKRPRYRVTWTFYAQQQVLLRPIARLTHRNSVCLSVRQSAIRVDQSKTVQATIAKSLPSAAWKTLVSGTVKIFHKFERGHAEGGR